MKTSRAFYLNLKTAVSIVQTRLRAKRAMALKRDNYLALKRAAIVVQKNYRAKKARTKFLKLKEASIIIQTQFRANQLMKTSRTSYLNLKTAVSIVQTRLRAKRAMALEMDNYLALKRAAIVVQKNYRGKKTRIEFLKLKNAANKIQQQFRAYQMMKVSRRYYTKLKMSVSFIQIKFRAKRAMLRAREEYKLMKAVLLIQRKWLARKEMKKNRTYYVALKESVIKVQQKFRANLLMSCTREHYLRMKISIVVIQNRYRANRVMVLQRKSFLELKNATIFIQRRFKANLKMRQDLCEYVQLRRAAVTIQKFVRGYSIRRKYAHLFTEEAREERRIQKLKRISASKIQALWRGYQCRHSGRGNEIGPIRRRLEMAGVNALAQNTLGQRREHALQQLIHDDPSLLQIIRALQDLDYITRRCKESCASMCEFLPEQMYLMLVSAGRSLPEMNASVHAVSILVNIYKCPVTRSHTWQPQHLQNLLMVMTHWADKEGLLFPCLCTLIWLFAHNAHYKAVLVELANFKQVMDKIQILCSRKQKMFRKSGSKTVGSVFSFYSELPLPSLNPDWGLNYPKKPHIFTNSNHAIDELFKILF